MSHWRATSQGVVSYRNSTSNHNVSEPQALPPQLYLIEILHQTTTLALILIRLCRCILSKFYIKPQLCHGACYYTAVVSYRNSTSNHNRRLTSPRSTRVVSYRNSTSNHNTNVCRRNVVRVVSYRNSTSNHNCECRFPRVLLVVSYRNSTSNHNYNIRYANFLQLYLIEILHQTTTAYWYTLFYSWLYLIEILHQTTTFRAK